MQDQHDVDVATDPRCYMPIRLLCARFVGPGIERVERKESFAHQAGAFFRVRRVRADPDAGREEFDSAIGSNPTVGMDLVCQS
jgi:hypothetical protein